MAGKDELDHVRRQNAELQSSLEAEIADHQGDLGEIARIIERADLRSMAQDQRSRLFEILGLEA